MNEDLEMAKRLKWLARGNAPLSVWQYEMNEAADTIDRLTAENKQLRADNERLRQALRIMPLKEGFRD